MANSQARSSGITRLKWTLFFGILYCMGTINAQENAPLVRREMQWSMHQWWIVSDHHYDRAGTLTESVFEYGFYSTSIRARYGLSDQLSATFVFPVINIAYAKTPLSGQKTQHSGLGDIHAGIQYTIRRDSALQLIGLLMFQIPVAEYAGILSTGSNSFDQLLQLQVYSYYHIAKADGWIGITGGFNNRGNDYNNELRYGIETGFLFNDKHVEASLSLHGISSLGTAENTFNRFPETLFGNQKEELILSPALHFKVSRSLAVGLQVDALLAGKNRAAGTGFEISVRKRG